MTTLLAAYEALLLSSRRQLAALEADEDEGFAAATEERDALFEAIRAREAEAAALDPEGRHAVASVIAQILVADRELGTALDVARARNQEALSGLQTGLAALQSYAHAGNHEALFIDRSQ